jgi:hypothetical protein
MTVAVSSQRPGRTGIGVAWTPVRCDARDMRRRQMRRALLGKHVIVPEGVGIFQHPRLDSLLQLHKDVERWCRLIENFF